MKIRNGFVSNSSSSSFIIAYKEGEKCPHCGRTDINLVDVIRNHGDSEGTRLNGDNSELIIKNHRWWDEEDIEKLQLDINTYLLDGYSIAEIEIDYHDTGLLMVLENQVKNGNIKLINGSIL